MMTIARKTTLSLLILVAFASVPACGVAPEPDKGPALGPALEAASPAGVAILEMLDTSS